MWLQLRCGFLLLMAIVWFVVEIIEPFKKTDQKRPSPAARLFNRPVTRKEHFHDELLEKLIDQGRFIEATEHLNKMILIARELKDGKREMCYLSYMPKIERAAVLSHAKNIQAPVRDDGVEMEFMR